MSGSLFMSLSVTSGPAAAEAWATASLTEAGFAAETGELLERHYDAGELPNLHAVVVIRHGKLVLERYFDGEDERWGEDLGKVSFGPEVLHDLRSVSKSIVGLLYGIALTEDGVPALDAPLVDHFDYPDLADDPKRRRITVEHALTMTLGLAWDESLPYSDPRNSEIAMELAEDRYRFILEQPIVAEPGSTWTYSGGSTALLAHLIARGSGRSLYDYAREKLFGPLGIEDGEWVAGTNGEAAAASGLRLTARDLARIGQLVLNQGRWGGRQVVPTDWLEASFARHVPSEDGLYYGYQWWLGQGRKDGKPWMAGFGNGGQRLVVFPDLDLAVVVLAGNYNQLDAWKLSVHIMTEVLFPSLR
jgi:CubicO group peptidase (beta-lactamase class C family)